MKQWVGCEKVEGRGQWFTKRKLWGALISVRYKKKTKRWGRCCRRNKIEGGVLSKREGGGVEDGAHVELVYKSINKLHFWFTEEPVILANQAHQVFYLEDPQNDERIEDDTLCRLDVDPIVVERLVMRHVANDFIDDEDAQLSP
ncbi:uncharacterized protein E5676_scaffold609G00470 [Cucumis melo var. makuwa]|uniref:DUF4216 domain-containing protein n=1 Tax=Cucumis melo var. makuwa TaxID=1194695 RepID=A0A5D3DD69_CUCMM|nr:uncharacterized protein E6C27_scaffold60G002730 [Cucumis melo var. makuwa]TYK21400.1 uncharacterized protein E5676_scaffold609G00470 [Cucumis melo var. makuwa]